MKGNEKLIKHLNQLLADELTAINQYMVHAEMCENWGYGKLNEVIRKRSIVEMKHAERLIERILFLEGRPIVSELNKLHIGAEVVVHHLGHLGAEMTAVKGYNAGIKLAVEVGDNATRDFLQSILNDEDGHVDEIEMHRDQIEQMGLQIYLASQK